MSTTSETLPVPVKQSPHWRVNIRPPDHRVDLIPDLKSCLDLVERNAVRFRGWDYPHWGGHHENAAYGNHWIASWSNFMGHTEYWRLYQSGQFIHLFAVREATDKAWDQKLRKDTQSHLSHIRDLDISSVPGFISLVNLFYTVTEIVEFTTRMAQSGVYAGPITLQISITGIKGFLLTTDWSRSWRSRYAVGENQISHTWTFNSDELLADSMKPTVDIIKWIVARFGWLDPSSDIIERDVSNFKKGLI